MFDPMRILSFLLLSFQILLMIGMDVVLFGYDLIYGVGGIVGILAYFIAYSISVDMVVSPSDFWFQSSWQIFKKKTGYALSAYLIVTVVAAAVLGMIFN